MNDPKELKWDWGLPKSGFSPKNRAEIETPTLATFLAQPGQASSVDCSPSPHSKATESSKLGFLTTWNQQCGLATYAKFLLDELPSDSFVVLAEKLNEPPLAPDQPNVLRCWQRGSADYVQLEKAIEQTGIKLLHLNCQYRFFVQPNFSLLLKKLRERGLKVIAHLHTAFSCEPELVDLINGVDHLIAHTPEVRLELIANGAGAEQVSVLPHGVLRRQQLSEFEKQAVRTQLNIPSGNKLLMSFGFIQRHKGIDGLLKAVAYLIDLGIPATGVIAGRPSPTDPSSVAYQAELEQIVKNIGIEQHIKFLNRYISDEEVAQYLGAADLVLMNYQSSYFESSGACALALGAGACVAASLAPALMSVGDAVWHMTAGYPPGLSAQLLLTNAALRNELRRRADSYCTEHAWPRIAQKLLAIYSRLGISIPETKKENAVDTQAPKPKGGALKVLMQNRNSTFTQPGGDTVLLEQLANGLKQRGIEVSIDLTGTQDPSNYDLVHLFNFALPELTRAFADRAFRAKVPYLVSTLCEDVPRFHNQSIALAQHIKEYVRRGQERSWFEQHFPKLASIPQAPRFENEWLARNASALLTNGGSETSVLQREYPGLNNITEIRLGYEINANGDAQKFVQEYGERNFILCVGRLETRKNQLMLLKALEDSELTVVLAGGGFTYQPDYVEAVRNFKRKGKTILLERLSPEMLASAYKAARVHALVSWYELPGLVSLEAAAYGSCNIVATRNGTTPDYFGNLAFYADPGDHQSIYNAVMAAYYAPVRTELASHVQQFSWSKMISETAALYERIARRPAGVSVSTAAITAPPAEKISMSNAGYDLATEVTSFQEILERGELAARSRDFERAHDFLDRAERLNPQSTRALRARAAVFLAQTETAKAMHFFEKAFALDNKDPKVLCGLGMCEMNSHKPERAYIHFVNALAIDPNNLVGILQLVDCANHLKRWDDLIEITTRYVQNHTDDVNIRYCLAGALYQRGDLDRAEKTLFDATKINPTLNGASELKEKINAARLAKTMGNNFRFETADYSVAPAQASSSATSPESQPKASQLQATSAIGDRNEQRLLELEELKRAKQYVKLTEAGIELLRDTTLSSTQRQHARLIVAESDILQGKVATAAPVFDQVLIENPISVRALCGKAVVYANSMNWEEAKKLFEQALSIDPRADVALAGLGLYYSWRKDSEQAWQHYQSALAINPENIRALLGSIELGYALKRLSAVERVVAKYLEMHPGDLDFVYALAGCYYAQERLQEAMAEVNKITLFKPEHERALELRKLIEERLEKNSTVHQQQYY